MMNMKTEHRKKLEFREHRRTPGYDAEPKTLSVINTMKSQIYSNTGDCDR